MWVHLDNHNQTRDLCKQKMQVTTLEQKKKPGEKIMAASETLMLLGYIVIFGIVAVKFQVPLIQLFKSLQQVFKNIFNTLNGIKPKEPGSERIPKTNDEEMEAQSAQESHEDFLAEKARAEERHR